MVNQSKIPKELLQAGLRPILINLADYKKLTVPGLEGLARLLQLLTNYFKVEIGRKLLDHLRMLAPPNKLEEVVGKPLVDIEEINLIKAILDIFPLLPPTSNVYLNDIIACVLELESRLKCVHSSPFRMPLMKFVNQYFKDSVDFFFGSLANVSNFELFLGLLDMAEARSLREETMRQIMMENTTFPLELTHPQFSSVILHRHALMIMCILAEHETDWLVSNHEVMIKLHNMWRTDISMRKYPANANHAWPCWNNGFKTIEEANDFGSIPSNRFSQGIYRIMIKVTRKVPENIDWLLEIINGFSDPDLIDTTFIKVFIYEDVVLGYDAPLRKRIFEKFLDVATQAMSYERRTNILSYLIIPMLLHKKCDPALFVTSQILETLIKNVWSPLNETSSLSLSGDYDSFVLSLLQLVTLLMQLLPQLVNEFRKDIIKFAWALLKSDDMIMKQAAYVLLARFIREYGICY
jgi:transformation/transcription domain-associated protein